MLQIEFHTAQPQGMLDFYVTLLTAAGLSVEFDATAGAGETELELRPCAPGAFPRLAFRPVGATPSGFRSIGFSFGVKDVAAVVEALKPLGSRQYPDAAGGVVFADPDGNHVTIRGALPPCR